jgi:minimal PKS chain-length factor (CLF/KS beta)
MSARAVISGVGVVAPSGIGAPEHWRTILAGERRIGPISLFNPASYATRLAGEVANFDVASHVQGRLTVQTDRWTWLAFAAAEHALDDAAIDPDGLDPYSMSVVLASSSGGNQFGQRELQRLWGRPDRTVGAYQSIAWFYAASVGQLSIKYQMKGPSSVLATESAGGLDSLAHAARSIRRGTSLVLAGGTEAPLSPYALACQQRSGWLSTVDDADRAYRPFDVDACGFVPAEGGAVVVVEDLEHALDRGVPHIYAEILSWGATHDGEPTGRGSRGSTREYARAMRLALDRASLRPADVDVVFPDALGVPEYDATEAEALRAVFGTDGPAAVTTQKPLLGRLYQGGSALDAVTAVLAMRAGVVPANAGPDRPALRCDLRFVTTTQPSTTDIAMVNARGFDGFNTSLLLRRWEPTGDGAPMRAGQGER